MVAEGRVADLIRRAERLVSAASGGEKIEIFIKEVDSTKLTETRVGPETTWRSVRWVAEVAVRDAEDRFGSAVTSDQGSEGLRRALSAARTLQGRIGIQAAAPERMSDPPEASYLESTHNLTPVRARLREARLRFPGCRVTVARTTRNILIVDSDGWRGAYGASECQLHLASSTAGAIGTDLATTMDDLSLEEAALELKRMQWAFALPRATSRGTDWVLFRPLASAQLLTRLAPGFLRSVREGAAEDVVGSRAVTVLDGPASGVPAPPFDDQGVQVRPMTLIDRGRLAEPLDGVYSGASGRRWRGDWRHAVRTAPVQLSFNGETETELDPTELSGTGITVEKITGGGGVTDWHRTPMPITVHGFIGSRGSGCGEVSVAADLTGAALLRAVSAVSKHQRPYRVRGLTSGGTLLLGGDVFQLRSGGK